VPTGPPAGTVEFEAFGTLRKENIRSDQETTLEDIIIAGANRSLIRTYVLFKIRIKFQNYKRKITSNIIINHNYII